MNWAYFCVVTAGLGAIYNFGGAQTGPSSPPSVPLALSSSSPKIRFASLEPAMSEPAPSKTGHASYSETTIRPPEPTASAPNLNTDKLAAAIQTELKRLGCYRGSVDNVWGGGSVRAMLKFERVSSLDLDERAPNAAAVLKLQSYDANICLSSKSVAVEQRSRPKHATLSAQAPVALNRDVLASASEGDDASYLPPWMRGTARKAGNAATATMAGSELRKKPRKVASKRTVVKVAKKQSSRSSQMAFWFGW